MKNLFRFLFIAGLCLWGCDDSASPEENSGNSEGADPVEAGDPAAPKPSCVSETCNGAKVCLMNDALNCGKCGNECAEGVPCVDGKCQTDKSTSPEESDPKEPEPKACDGKLCNDECVDVNTDVRHCGDCDHACGDNQHCSEAKCACDDSLTMCSEVCADLKTDDHNCGECGVQCGDGQHCSDAKCVCDDSLTMCLDVCVDVKTDDHNCGECGTQCGEGLHCSDAKCVCDDSLTMCSDVCVDVKTDEHNCGACGVQCGEGQHCSDAKCVCDDSLKMCSDVCVDVKTDKNNCGACGTQCGKSQHCSDMKCVCDDSLTMCSDVCVDLKKNKNNCGACGKKCGTNQTCTDGSCKDNPSGGAGVVAYAEQFLYDETKRMCTFDYRDELPGFQNFSTYGNIYNCGYDLNCANFVIACLRNTNELTPEMFAAIPGSLRYSVEGVRTLCEDLNVGYRVIDVNNAQIGDIWYWKEEVPERHSHTELVVKVEGNKIKTIGSNNFPSGRPQPVCQKVCEISADTYDYQAVTYNEHGITEGKVCSKR